MIFSWLNLFQVFIEEFQISFEVELWISEGFTCCNESRKAATIHIVFSEKLLDSDRKSDSKRFQFLSIFAESKIPYGKICSFHINEEIFELKRDIEYILKTAESTILICHRPPQKQKVIIGGCLCLEVLSKDVFRDNFFHSSVDRLDRKAHEL